MASLKKLVETYQEDLLDGISWVVFWKVGHYWHADTIFTEFDADEPDQEYEPITVETKGYLQAIYNQDNKAIILNGYYCKDIGNGDDTNSIVLTQLIRNYHENQYIKWYRVKTFLETRNVILPEAKTENKEMTGIDVDEKKDICKIQKEGT